MPSFCAVFNCSNLADREKDKPNYRFPQIFRKYLTDRELERSRTRIKEMLSASPSLFFPHKVHNTKFEKQIRFLS